MTTQKKPATTIKKADQAPQASDAGQAKLSAGFKQQILDALCADQWFEPTDFDIDTGRQGSFFELTIRYRAVPAFYMHARAHIEEPSPIITLREPSVLRWLPGAAIHDELIEIATIHDIPERAKAWTQRVRQELRATRMARQLEEQQQRVEELAQSFAGAADTFFTRTEASEVKRILDELKAQIAAHIAKADTEQAEMKDRLEALERDMAIAKQQLEVLTKKGWAMSFLAKFARWASRAESQQLMLTTGKTLKQLLTSHDSSNDVPGGS